jgi:hypothetical protein
VTRGLDARQGFPCVLVVAVAVSGLLLGACDGVGPGPTPVPTGSAAPDAVATEGAALLTQAPTIPSSTPVPSPAGLDPAETNRIYAAVVARLIGSESPPYVYVNPYIGQGERLDDPNDSQPLPAGLPAALPSTGGRPKYEMLEFADAIGPLEDGGKVKNDGVFITLGPIQGDPSEKDVLVVRGSIYHMVGTAEGSRFRLRRDPSAPGGWTVIDSTQEWSD